MTRQTWLPGLGIVAAVLVLSGCAGSAARIGGEQGTGFAQLPAASAAAAAPVDAAPSTASARDAFNASGSGTGGPANAVPAPDQALIVKTGSMVLDVVNLDSALAKAQAAVAGLGGYVSGSDRSGQGDQQVASVTYRIPAGAWDRALDAVRALGTRVEKEQTSSVEVTGQVLDLGARIANLQATESALQAIMARATKIPDVLAVQQQLTDVQGQIEQLTTERQHLQQQAAMSTLTVVFQVPVVAVTTATAGWNPGAQVDRATAQLIELGQAVASAAIWASIVGLPILLVLLLALVPGAWIARRLFARVRPGGPRGPSEPMWGPGTAPGA
jgi:Domain of unknown function (DUF4349)